MFPEALLLSIIDLLDARLEQAWRVIDQGSAGEEWTAYVPSLERQTVPLASTGSGSWFGEGVKRPGGITHRGKGTGPSSRYQR